MIYLLYEIIWNHENNNNNNNNYVKENITFKFEHKYVIFYYQNKIRTFLIIK